MTSSPSGVPTQGQHMVTIITSFVTLSNDSFGKGNVVPDGCLNLAPQSGSFVPWDNPDNLLSQNTARAFDRAVSVVCLPSLFLVSVPCNLLNMLVFYRQGLRERINLCLFYLSVVDFLHMLANFVYNVDRLIFQFTKENEIGPVLEFFLVHYIVGFCSGFSTGYPGFISMLIACERCLCVVHPLRSQTILKWRTTAGILAVATVVILAGAAMSSLRRGLACVYDPVSKTTARAIYTSEFYAKHKAHLDAISALVVMVQPFIYVTVVSATTVVTSVRLSKMGAWRAQAASSTLSSREVALTRTLIAVSILYIICSLPSFIAGLCVVVIPGVGFSGRYYNFSKFVVSCIELASLVNATFNFFVYCFLGSKYKETLRALFQRKDVSSLSAADRHKMSAK